MSIVDAFKAHKAVENPEFGQKKKLVGDAVAQVQSLDKITSKKGAEWVILKTNVIHPIADPKGRETTVISGDEIVKMYDPNDSESVADLKNDLFTAGIDVEFEAETEEEFYASLASVAKDKLIYFRTWAKDKTKEQMEKNPNSSFFQNIVIKSKNMITPENSVAELPF